MDLVIKNIQDKINQLNIRLDIAIQSKDKKDYRNRIARYYYSKNKVSILKRQKLYYSQQANKKSKKEPKKIINKNEINKIYPELATVQFKDVYGDYRVYKNGVVINKYGETVKLVKKGEQWGQKRCSVAIRINGNTKEVSLAKLLATLFIPNPKKHPKVIFKDKNLQNNNIENLQWVSNKEYMRHIGMSSRASYGCACEILSKFYLTGDEKYINDSFNKAYNQITFDESKQLRTILFEYFYSRLIKYKVAYDPKVLLINYRREARKKLRLEQAYNSSKNSSFIENYDHNEGSLYKKINKQIN